VRALIIPVDHGRLFPLARLKGGEEMSCRDLSLCTSLPWSLTNNGIFLQLPHVEISVVVYSSPMLLVRGKMWDTTS